jgi:hypothetical protein
MLTFPLLLENKQSNGHRRQGETKRKLVRSAEQRKIAKIKNNAEK